MNFLTFFSCSFSFPCALRKENNVHSPLKLMLVTRCQDTDMSTYLNFIETCAQAGITSVQMREKEMEFNKKITFAHQLKILLDTYKIPLIINDDPLLAQQVDAGGIHLGQSDLIEHPFPSRSPSSHFGLSANTLKQVEDANHRLDLSYLGIGAIFPTTSKMNVETVWGLEGLKQAKQRTTLPLVAIGGITADNAAEVLQAGAYGLAIINAIHAAHDPAKTIHALLNTINALSKRSPHV